MTTLSPEFSRIVPAETVDENGSSLDIEADKKERSMLAQRFGLAGLETLTAALRLTLKEGGALIRLEGAFKAEIVQTCVVSQEPIETLLEGSIKRLYDTSPEPADGENGGEAGGEDDGNIDFDAEDPPEEAPEGKIDVGEVVAEQLALEIDPFPRKPGLSFADFSTDPGDGDKNQPRSGPFDTLARLKKKLK
jgi:uncharacterized metal-binding protein YceD (DUF177 family)